MFVKRNTYIKHTQRWCHLGPVGAALGSAGIGAAASIFGGSQANAASAKQAKLNRDFQERMTKNKHFYEVADLRKAGLNPILSANAGGAVPSGSMAPQKDIVTPAVTSALQMSLLKANVKNVDANTDLTTAKKNAIAPASTIGEAAGKAATYGIGEIDNIILDLKAIPSDRGNSAKQKSNFMRGLTRIQNLLRTRQNNRRLKKQYPYGKSID